MQLVNSTCDDCFDLKACITYDNHATCESCLQAGFKAKSQVAIGQLVNSICDDCFDLKTCIAFKDLKTYNNNRALCDSCIQAGFKKYNDEEQWNKDMKTAKENDDYEGVYNLMRVCITIVNIT